jgi:hypothetical protein
MANTVSILSYANTFGELVTNINAVAKENNDLAANNYVKSTGTLFLNDNSLGLQVQNNAIIQGGLQVQGIGSSAYVQNNLRVDQQVYFTNTTLGLTNSGQANIGGPLYALSSANSIIASNNVSVGGNTFTVGSIYTANNLSVAKSATIGSSMLVLGAANVANTLTVTQNVHVTDTTDTDKLVSRISTTATSYVTGLLDAGLAFAQLNNGSANTMTINNGYISTIRANNLINTTSLLAGSVTTPLVTANVANVISTIDAPNATAFIKNVVVGDQLSVSGNFVINGSTIYNSNTFTLNAGSGIGMTSEFIVNRGIANAAIRWNEPQSFWDINDIITDTYYRIITEQQITDSLTSQSNILASSAFAANSLNNLINGANTYLQSVVGSAGSFANGAFYRANAAFASANNVAPQIVPAFNQANSGYARANTSANLFVGTSGQGSPLNGAFTFASNNGIKLEGSSNTLYVSTSQDLRTTATPTFNSLVLNAPLAVNQGGTGGQSAGDGLKNLLPTTVGVSAGQVLATTGGGGGSFYWTTAASGGGAGGATPGTSILSSRTFAIANSNQTIFTNLPTYVPGASQLRVFIDGVRQFPSEYTETSNTSIQLSAATNPGSTLMFEVDGYYVNPYYANNITYGPATGAIAPSANTIQLAIDSLEARKATLASPQFTGVPLSVTAPLGTSNSWIATTGFVSAFANANYTLSHSITGNAGSVTNGVYTNGSYTDPAWLTISKAKVGLNNVDNTADANKSVYYASFTGALATGNSYTMNYLNISAASGEAQLSLTFSGQSYATYFYKNSGTALGFYSPQLGSLFTLDYSGNFTAKANITAYSDESLKKNWRALPTDFVQQLAQLKSGIYDRTDGDLTQVGVGAQSLQKFMPNAVVEGADGKLAVAYGNAALVSSVELAKVIVDMQDTIKQLQAEIEVLKGK